ncbi:MAG TPA: DHA2 family efflux MFS transporter permease subunit [Candidatus Acidoferrales bacterium]|nr:DHA2 family efflux MFS transporter permease subunit [Candidatus Acidoferrales bacterium]
MADAAPSLDRTALDASTEIEAAVELPRAAWRPTFNPWLIAVVVAMAAFMEVLDTSIANVALPYMAGNLGVSNDESTWVLTSYLVSNAVVLPISGWLVTVVGRKRLFMLCLAMFTLSSLLCGLAPSLGLLILFRILQGAGGGGLQPLAQSILADSFPPEKRGIAFAVYGITVIVAPTVGPTLGGWITDNYTWRWIFFINIPVGVLTLLLVLRFVENPPWANRIKDALARIDYIGISLLIVGVGALQVMLDKGQEDDWFGSRFILTFFILAAGGLLALFIWEWWFSKNPVVDVRLYKNLNFLGANTMMFTLGVIYFSSLVLMPQYLQTLMGYTAETSGFVLSGGSAVLLFTMPLIGVLSGKFQARYLIALGWLSLALGFYYSAVHLDLDISFGVASVVRVMQVVGLPFLFVPINLASFVGMPSEKSSSVSGLVNFMRNIGSSVGTSLVTTLIARRAQLHQINLVANLTSGGSHLRNVVGGLSNHLAVSGANGELALRQSYAFVYRSTIGQATTLAYMDTYMILAIGAAVMFALSFALRKNELGGRRIVVE